MSEPTMLWVHNFDAKNRMADEVDLRTVSVEMLSDGITILAFDGEALVGIKEMSYEQLWRKAVGE